MRADDARFGAVTFVHRFSSALNVNLHFYCCVIDGVFSVGNEGGQFHRASLTDTALAQMQRQTRHRVLKLFQRREVLSPDAAERMRSGNIRAASPSMRSLGTLLGSK